MKTQFEVLPSYVRRPEQADRGLPGCEGSMLADKRSSDWNKLEVPGRAQHRVGLSIERSTLRH